MKTLWKSFKITIAFCIFFSLFYILVLWIFAQFAGPNKGNAEVATLNGKVVGAANVGQMFTQDIYFWGRPSAGNYTADASGGRTMNTWQKWKPVSILFWYIILI
mgnify:CR=1 FL=1